MRYKQTLKKNANTLVKHLRTKAHVKAVKAQEETVMANKRYRAILADHVMTILL